MIELLRPAAAEVPDQPVVLSDTRQTSYAELLRLAESAATTLVRRRVPRSISFVGGVETSGNKVARGLRPSGLAPTVAETTVP